LGRANTTRHAGATVWTAEERRCPEQSPHCTQRPELLCFPPFLALACARDLRASWDLKTKTASGLPMPFCHTKLGNAARHPA
jgi:hypothetical protein